MNMRLIQSQWGIAIAVIASEHRAALMLQRNTLVLGPGYCFST